jgi:predicted ATPase
VLTCLFQGEFVDCRGHLEEALRICDPLRDRDAKFRFGTDTGASATAYLANAGWHLGEVGRARVLIEEAVARAAESVHVPTRVNVYYFNALYEIFRGDAKAVLDVTETLLELCREHAIAIYLAFAELYSAWARARLDGGEAGTTDLRQALTAYTEQGNKVNAPLFEGLLAELEAEGQGAEEALTRVDEALALAGETGEHWTDALLHRIRGEILLKCDPANTAPAEEAFLTAIAIAQQQKARSFELRAALSLTRLWRDQGKRENARELLAQVYGWFTEGFDTLDLKEAKVLLDELHA